MSVILPNLFLFGFLALIVVVAVVVLIRRGGSEPHVAWKQHWLQNPAISELDVRYARGDIDREEYLQRRADLIGQATPSQPGPSAGADS
jgi:uncharacterized membrane protein